jgi:6-phosphofructokinase 1
MKKIKSIAVLTSGGDSPGMNCAIRAVVRTGIQNGLDVFGIRKGYSGLLEGAMDQLDVSSVGNILQRGGTILQTSRCQEFHQADARKKAANFLKSKGIGGLVVIGGNGSVKGAMALSEENGIAVVGVPGTIDNDISGTDYTIGFDTAVQTAVEAVDKIRDTASSHARVFIVEVMGRASSALAVHVGIGTGAEDVIFPTKKTDFKSIADNIQRGMKRGKNSSILIVAEGERPGFSYEIRDELKDKHQVSAHVCILGHIQRGGNPSGLDRFLASRMGYLAVESLVNYKSPQVAAFVEGLVKMVDFSQCLHEKQDYEVRYLEMMRTLSI